MSIKEKTIHGFKWSFINMSAGYGFQFFTSIILARLLNPNDFGIAGMATIFIALSNVFVEGGMGDSLIRRKNADDRDYNSIFFFNIFISIIFYAVLFFLSSWIASYLGEFKFALVIQVSSIGLIINSLSIVQIAILRKQLDFKRQAIISFVSSFVGASTSITMAYLGFSYWSLIIPSLITGVITATLLTVTSSWKPKLYFNISIIRDHFAFSSKIMAGSFVNVIHQKIYHAFIGKNFTMSDLGYYYKADSLRNLPSSNLDAIVRHVTYPVLATMLDDSDQLKKSYQTLIKYTALLNGLIMLLLANLSEQVVLVLFGKKWLPSVPYLQLLCLVGLLMPITSINTNVVNVKGRSDISFYLTILNILLSIPVLIVGYFCGIKLMIVGMCLAAIIRYIILIFITKWFINYPIQQQLSDVSKSLIFAISVVAPVFLTSVLINLNPLVELVILIPIFLFSLIVIGRFSKQNEYMQLETIVLKKLLKN